MDKGTICPKELVEITNSGVYQHIGSQRYYYLDCSLDHTILLGPQEICKSSIGKIFLHGGKEYLNFYYKLEDEEISSEQKLIIFSYLMDKDSYIEQNK